MNTENTENKTTQEPLTLGYWKIRGLAHQIRYLLEYLNVPYNEVMYEQGDGPHFSTDEWKKAIPHIGMQFWNLPYLFDGKLKMSETNAIMRYIVKKFGPELEGKTLEDFAIVEQMVGVLGDIKSAISETCYGDGDIEKLKKNVNPEIQALEDFMKGRKFVAGDYVTYVDFIFYELNELMEFVTNNEHFKTFPNLKVYNQNVASLDKIAKYIVSDRYLKIHRFNNKSAKI